MHNRFRILLYFHSTNRLSSLLPRHQAPHPKIRIVLFSKFSKFKMSNNNKSQNYRGPYFRTGVDGVGNYWELSDWPSQSMKSKKRIVTRKPSAWELQKPKSPRLLASSPDEISGMSKDRLVGAGAESPTEAETFITKEKLREMMMEILSESIPILPNPPPLKSTTIEEKPKPGEVPAAESRKKFVRGLTKVSIGSNHGIPPPPLPKVDPLPPSPIEYRVGHREEKMRTFECFRKMSYDPPKTPPPLPAMFETMPTDSHMSIGTEKKVVKKRSKRSKTTIPHPENEPTTDPFHQARAFYPEYAQFQALTLPQFRGVSHHRQASKIAKTHRSPLTKEESLNSTMIVKKVPLINGFFDDSMLPPILSPVPKPKVVKKPIDAWPSLDWAQEHRNQLNVFARQLSEANQQRPMVSMKPEPKMSTKPKKPVHPSKQFPVHVPGPKKENLFIGPYIASELDLLRRKGIRSQGKK